MRKIKKLGEKCTSSICHKDCPIAYFNTKGAGANVHNDCVETMRFPTVAAAVDLWISGKEWDKESLMKFGGDYD